MKKKLITIVLVLAMALGMAVPAFAAATVDDVVAALQALAEERPATEDFINGAIADIRAEPWRVSGNAETIIGHINNAAAVGRGTPLAQLSTTQINSIVNQVDAAMSLAGLRIDWPEIVMGQIPTPEQFFQSIPEPTPVATPAPNLAIIEAAVNALAAARPGTGPIASEIISWMRANPSRVAGNEGELVNRINAIAGMYSNVPFEQMTLAQLTSIFNAINAAANLIGLSITVDLGAFVGGAIPSIAALRAAVRVMDGNTQIWPAPGRPDPDGVIRQTGVSADYGSLAIAMSVLALLFGAAMVSSARLKLGTEE